VYQTFICGNLTFDRNNIVLLIISIFDNLILFDGEILEMYIF